MGQKRERPSIDRILRAFFARQLHGTTGATRRRIVRVHDGLRRHLEVTGEHLLGTDDLTLLRLERDLDARDAFARLTPVDVLVPCLPEFLEASTEADGRTRLLLVERLAAHLVDARLIDPDIGALHGLRRAIEMAKRHDDRGAR